MGNNFFAYLQQLELMAFFSGYPLLYTFVLFFAENKQPKNTFKSRLVSVLPYGYALIGTLYLGFQLKALYFNYSTGNIKEMMHLPWLMIWALLSTLFWIPAVNKKKGLSLIHSLVFFFLLVRDFIIQFPGSSADKDVLKNDMRIYSISLLLNTGAFVIVLLLSFLFHQTKGKV
jgi:hypothetical protein